MSKNNTLPISRTANTQANPMIRASANAHANDRNLSIDVIVPPGLLCASAQTSTGAQSDWTPAGLNSRILNALNYAAVVAGIWLIAEEMIKGK
jgi:hypothetical protein